MRARDKVVIITGGGSGIGRATARLYAREGSAVSLVGRRKSALTRVADQIIQKGGKALTIATDITQDNSAEQVVRATLERFKHIDVLINNAGIAGPAVLVHETGDDIWNELIAHNLTACFRMAREVLKYFSMRANGIIVNVSSIAGLVGMPNMSAYSVAKSGLIALTRSIAVEYAHLGIRCNCVCPGTTQTPMTQGFLKDPVRSRDVQSYIPLDRVAKASEIAASIFYLGSDESSFITGAVMPVDGGFTAC
jgi:meso-butanediol dehydrogenase/(S,S)-butanediol dehydrogenase/diacetyl reductase